MNIVRKMAAILLCIATLLSFAACEEAYEYTGDFVAVNFEKKLKERSAEERGEWGRRADAMQTFMYENMLRDDGTFHNAYPVPMSADSTFHYWIQAQMVDSMADAYIRTGDKVYAQRAKDLINAVKQRNGNHLTNDFFDDMGWMACAMAKLYLATEDADLMPDLYLLYEVIMDSWYYDGGIAWSTDTMYYRNSPANGPACILACRMYQITGEQKYLDKALKIFEWWDATLIDHETGLVWDGLNREMDNKIDKNWIFTYCQGVYIGSCVELAALTQDSSYLDKAVKTADYVLENMMRDGVLPAEGDSDGGAFKGILCRYMVELIAATETNRQAYIDCLLTNAEKMWSNIPSEDEVVCYQLWSYYGQTPVTLQTQTSGVALLESVATLQINGYISDPVA